MPNQLKFLDFTGSQYLVQKVKSAINDVDSSLSTHIADTDIHVTTADKNKWNNQTYVFRYSSTALTASSTNSNALLDNTDNLKVGDKVIDSSGVLFSITAIDTQNSTFTIGTALIDLAQDSDVVHKSGNETVGGVKSFSDDIIRGLTTIASRTITGSGNTPAIGSNGVGFIQNKATLTYQDSTPTKTVTVTLEVQDSAYSDGNSRAFFPTSNNITNLGKSGKRWANVYATNYYYGGSEVEFSTKFVTTDTNQSISGNKTWSGLNTFKHNITYERTNFYHQAVSPCYILKDTELEKGSLASTHSTAYPGLWQDKNNNILGYVRFVEYSSGRQTAEFRVSNFIKNGTLDPTGSEVNCTVNLELRPSGDKSLIPEQNNDINLGTSTNKWKTFNGVEPSSLSLPSGNASDIIDISSYLVNLDGTDNTYVAPSNGWITINMNNCTGIHATITGFWGDSRVRTSAGAIKFLMPVLKNQTVTLTIHGGTINNARFIPCQGNV